MNSPVTRTGPLVGLKSALARPIDLGPVATALLRRWVEPDGEQGESLGRCGDLEVRLATDVADVRRAQRLRYQVFYEELSALPDMRARFTRRDSDIFDPVCDHMLVLDHCSRPLPRKGPRVVGTYRLLRQERAALVGGFYSASEFQVGPLVARHAGLRFLELGRSCVLPDYRSRRTLELLWHGIWRYVLSHRCDVMIGCASLRGTDPERLAPQLSFLHHFAAAAPEWQVAALPSRRVEMNRIAKGKFEPAAVLRDLPPLVKGYLRLGAVVGDGAVIDRAFGTTDVLMVLPVSRIRRRYIEHFSQIGAGGELPATSA